MKSSKGYAISLVYPIMRSITGKGLDFRRFCERISFDMRQLQDVEARIDEEELERLMYEAAKFTQDDYFGLQQGKATDVADMGILGYVMMHSEKVIDALAAYRRYHVILCSGYHLEWEERGEDVWLRFFKPGLARASRHCMEDMISSLYHLTVRISNRAIAVKELRFAHEAPADIGPYVATFGVEPAFGTNDNMLRVSKEVLHYPILYSDARLRRAFEPIAEDIMRKLVQGKEFSDRVFQWMMKCMPARFPTLQQTADAFKMSSRTLQAKLKEEDVSYNDLAQRVRKEFAVSYLAKWEHSVAEIAYLLHYSEPSAFQNAFKKWTGFTPGEYRTNAKRNTAASE
ncbi:AraC family transcriptional regulator [Paenibacillus hamazuiensis]|uniref:AraC family transcriptional regulator n=1 Tax=Paenibacillus hamazuiensis TaxID=2936508 RepID=UPI00200D8A31|nr:AraC family transcriptional regulator [Paenibacillus hamazuiensis]